MKVLYSLCMSMLGSLLCMLPCAYSLVSEAKLRLQDDLRGEDLSIFSGMKGFSCK